MEQEIKKEGVVPFGTLTEGVCAYKNCDNIIIGGRKNKKFCCRSCKQNNRKVNKYYVERKKTKLEN